jgi:hypothetical protein
MNYPHWFCKVTASGVDIPIAVMLISEVQAKCAVDRYVKNIDYEHITPFTLYDSLDHLRSSEGLALSDIIVLTDDHRGKCVAFRYCDSPGGRCDVTYYDCGCFI